MSEINREELCYSVERWIADRDAVEQGTQTDEVPYIQEGDVEDVIVALEALGYKVVKA